MSIGYACITLGKRNINLKRCILKNVTQDKLKEIIEHNLTVLDQQISYNVVNNIKLFRISSDIIPYGSHQANKIPWWDIYEERLKSIGHKIKENDLRVSMHPGQYTVLNSPKEDVVNRAVDDLLYHTRFLDSLGVPSSCKIILHIGGVYGDKNQGLSRFQDNYLKLSDSIKKRLVIENDEKCYNISEVLTIGKRLFIPVIFDNLHHQINPPEDEFDDSYWIIQVNKTWMPVDGKQKVHYSQQCHTGKIGSHSQSVDILEFIDYYYKNRLEDIDVMLEVKDKDLSALKCIHCTENKLDVTELEKQWSKYKYTVLGKNAAIYNTIREILKEKNRTQAIEFYLNIEAALKMPENKGAENNSALHVWGYFKKISTDSERRKFYKTLELYMQGEVTLKQLKRVLKKLADKYDIRYLLQSHYFYLP